MKTLLLAIITLSACASRQPATLPTDQTTMEDLIECQVKVFEEWEALMANKSKHAVIPQTVVDGVVRGIKQQSLHCYRVKSQIEQDIDAVINRKN